MKACAWTGAALSVLWGAVCLHGYRPAIPVTHHPLEHQSPQGDLLIPGLPDADSGPVRAAARRGDHLHVEIPPSVAFPWREPGIPAMSWTLSREGVEILRGGASGLSPVEWAWIILPAPLAAGLAVGAVLGIRRRRLR